MMVELLGGPRDGARQQVPPSTLRVRWTEGDRQWVYAPTYRHDNDGRHLFTLTHVIDTRHPSAQENES